MYFKIMAKLQQYKSFKALKAIEKSEIPVKSRKKDFSEFESFMLQLRNEYSQQKKVGSTDGNEMNF
jgi:hypothetical protein